MSTRSTAVRALVVFTLWLLPRVCRSDDAEIVYLGIFFTGYGESSENYFRLMAGNAHKPFSAI